MRKLLLAASLAAAAATVPAVSEAATRCERDNATNRVGGTVIGAGVGALLGSAIAGNSSNTEGTIIGGIAGAIAGNQIAKNTSQPCPPGYVLYDERGPVAAPPPAPAPVAAPARDYRDGRYAERDDWFDDRGGFDRNRFWAGAPTSIDERIEFLERRIRRGIDNGTVTRREADRAFASLDAVRREEFRLRRQGGGRLGPRDRDYLQRRLDDVSAEVRWARNNGPRRY